MTRVYASLSGACERALRMLGLRLLTPDERRRRGPLLLAMLSAVVVIVTLVQHEWWQALPWSIVTELYYRQWRREKTR